MDNILKAYSKKDLTKNKITKSLILYKTNLNKPFIKNNSNTIENLNLYNLTISVAATPIVDKNLY
jgi:hypothetical protein